MVRDGVISDRYRLEKEIGAGGMARVWRAHDLTLDRPVAVKFLFLREDRDQKTMIDRFLREARIAASVRHPNVVDVLDFGTMPNDGRPFMVMELLEGRSLDDRLSIEPTCSARDLLKILVAALDGLSAVHKVGIVHRDLKPDNIFLLDEDDGVRPKLLDFGVSKETDASSGRRSALTTNAGYLVGTPEYMSPEQARGLKDIDWRTDFYSLGVVLYEALTGRLPYRAEAVGDLIIEIVGGEAPTVGEVRPEVGGALSGVVAKAMAASREDRFQSAREMREALLEASASGELDSVHALVPARTRVIDPGPASLNSLDGELAWGAGAVPDFGAAAPAQQPRETLAEETAGAAGTNPPHAKPWTVDTELPIAERRNGPWLLVGAALAVLLLGAIVWLASSSPDVDAEGATANPTELASPRDLSPTLERGPPALEDPAVLEDPEDPAALEDPEDPAELEDPATVAAAPAFVTVTLTGLPANAVTRVDGDVVHVEEGALEVPRDGEAHEIRVEAPRRRPWTTRHRAVGNGSYRVHLRRVAPPSRRGRTGAGVFRDLDY